MISPTEVPPEIPFCHEGGIDSLPVESWTPKILRNGPYAQTRRHEPSHFVLGRNRLQDPMTEVS